MKVVGKRGIGITRAFATWVTKSSESSSPKTGNGWSQRSRKVSELCPVRVNGRSYLLDTNPKIMATFLVVRRPG
jgi:hypothetical protein